MYRRDDFPEFKIRCEDRVERAVESIKNGSGALVLDDEDRENECDFVFAAERMSVESMAMTIRHGSGIVCLCLGDEYCRKLDLPMMVEHNKSRYRTAFTVSVEASRGITTGVSASDRIVTIRTAIADGTKPSDLNRPGHVFPLRSEKGGVLERAGHTESAVDLASLAGLKPAGVICEMMNDDGSMARLPEVISFSRKHSIPIMTVRDLVRYLSKDRSTGGMTKSTMSRQVHQHHTPNRAAR